MKVQFILELAHLIVLVAKDISDGYSQVLLRNIAFH
jgi:hypothetical protein